MGPDTSLTPELIQGQSFTTSFRGYDPGEVKTFLSRVATEMRAWKERAEGLESAWHSAEERAARPPVLDEDTLMAAVGEETAAILRTARAAAAELRAKAAEEAERTLAAAREEAERTLNDAREEADRTLTGSQEEAERTLTDARREAEQVLGDARAEAETALAHARSEAERLEEEARAALAAVTSEAEEAAATMVETARREASELLERVAAEAEGIRAKADQERQLTIEGANSTRDRILEDLSRRRRVATVQIEQLRAGRERLIESYAVVRRTLEEVQSELSRADAEARAAADEVGRRLKDQAHPELTESSRSLPNVLSGGVIAEGDTSKGSTAAPAAEDRPAGAAEEGAAQESAREESAVAEPAIDEPAVAESAAEEPAAEEPAADSPIHGAAVDEPADPNAVAADDPLDAPAATEERPQGGSGASGHTSAVDQLFARIRGTGSSSGKTHAGSEAPATPSTPASADDGTSSAPSDAHDPSTADDSPAAHDVPAADDVPATDDVPAAHDVPADPHTDVVPSAPSSGPKRGAKKRGAGRSPDHDAPAHAGPATAVKARSTVRVIEPEAQSSPAATEGPSTEDPATDDQDAEVVATADESLLQTRDFAVTDLEASLTRRLKRALQDEQNDVLDRLRNLKGTPHAEALLPSPAEQVARYAGAARPLLCEAATAGAIFTDETLGLPGRDEPVDVDVADLAEECGSGIVSPLRRRLEQAIESGAGEDQAVLVESLGAAYREWKTQRIERLAGDVLSAAFSRGTWLACPPGARLRWVVEDADGPCPDCDDDALAGDIPKGEAFPTGQAHPPAHSGCRCLLVPILP